MVALRNRHPLLRSLIVISPIILAIALVFLMRIPVRNEDIGPYLPHISLIVVYYFILNRPGFMPPIALFFIGFLDDFASGGSLGVTSFVLLIISVILSNQEKITQGQAFMVSWVGFLVISLIAFPLSWLLYSFTHGSLLPMGPMASQAIVTLLSYPLIYIMLLLFNRRVLS